MDIQPKTVIVTGMILLLLIIFFQNTGIVSFRILFWELSMSRAILLPLIMAIGMVAGILIGRRFRNW